MKNMCMHCGNIAFWSVSYHKTNHVHKMRTVCHVFLKLGMHVSCDAEFCRDRVSATFSLKKYRCRIKITASAIFVAPKNPTRFCRTGNMFCSVNQAVPEHTVLPESVYKVYFYWLACLLLANQNVATW